MDALIESLSQRALELANSGIKQPRLIVGLVAIPAAGKTTLAKLLSAEINKKCGRELSAVLPMDGFHLTRHSLTHRKGPLELNEKCSHQEENDANKTLETIETVKKTDDSRSGSSIEAIQGSDNYTESIYQTTQRDFRFELMNPYNSKTQLHEENCIDDQVYCVSPRNKYISWPGSNIAYAKRGAPFTFDPFLLASALTNVKYHYLVPKNEHIWPGWDHAAKDPSYDEDKQVKVSDDVTLVILEGLYLLLTIEPWVSLLHGNRYSYLFQIPGQDGAKNDEKRDGKNTDKNSDQNTQADSTPAPISPPLIDFGVLLTCDEDVTIERGAMRNWKAGITATLEESIDRWRDNDIVNGRFLVKHLFHDKIKFILNQEDVGILMGNK
jgi:pantothenate kinase